MAGPSDVPWVRWTGAGGTAYAIVDGSGPVTLTVAAGALDAGSAHLPDGTPVAATAGGDRVTVRIPPPEVEGPAVVAFRSR